MLYFGGPKLSYFNCGHMPFVKKPFFKIAFLVREERELHHSSYLADQHHPQISRISRLSFVRYTNTNQN
jgi:hypothetical protein